MTISDSKNSPDFQHFDRATCRPAPARGPISHICRWISTSWLRLGGWTIEGDWPDIPHAVLVAAPHTSNWDGTNMLAAAAHYRVKLRWMGKKELTTGFWGPVVKWLGCVPVDRSGNNDLVNQMADAFADATEANTPMILAIPPEGTRSKTSGWKTGYYHIAHKANVPIILSVLDYGTKTIRLSGALRPTGDYDADFAWIKHHYEDAKGKRKRQFVVE